jgi:hypothetical protein
LGVPQTLDHTQIRYRAPPRVCASVHLNFTSESGEYW